MSAHFVLILAPVLFLIGNADLQSARDRQDGPALDKMIAGLKAKADKQPNDAQAHYKLAFAQPIAAEVTIEIRDKASGRGRAEGSRSCERSAQPGAGRGA